jgi:hypothetical protein
MHIPREANQVVDSLVKSIACKVVGPCKYSKFACDFIVIPLVADIHVSLFLCAVSTSIVRGLRPPLFEIFFSIIKTAGCSSNHCSCKRNAKFNKWTSDDHNKILFLWIRKRKLDNWRLNHKKSDKEEVLTVQYWRKQWN